MWCPNQECPDALETGSPAELRDEIVSCPFCGASLVSSMPDWAVPQREEPTWVPVLTIARDSWLPQLKALLDSAGIRYLVSDEGVRHLIGWGTAAFGFNPLTGAPVLMVEESEVEKANAVLADFKAAVQEAESVPEPAAASTSVSTPASPTRCNACGKELESSEGDEPLTDCYHCGAALGANA